MEVCGTINDQPENGMKTGYGLPELWHDDVIKLPVIKKLQKDNVCLVSDLIGITWEIMSKEEIQRARGVDLNLEYLSIKQGIKEFIKNAEKRVNIGPYRPYMLKIVFSQRRDVKTYIERQANMESKFYKKYPKNRR